MRPLNNELPEGWEPDVSYLLPGWRYDAVVARYAGLVHATKSGRKRYGEPPETDGRSALEIIEANADLWGDYREVETQVLRHARWFIAIRTAVPAVSFTNAEFEAGLILRSRGWSDRAIARHIFRNPNGLYRSMDRMQAA